MTDKPENSEQDYPRLFGSSGVRGVFGEDLPEELCRDVARALGSTLPPHAWVCIATDSRLSRGAVGNAVASGLRSTGINVTMMGILPTPALAFLTRKLGFDTGVMVTASHNPPEFNGIKLFNADCIGYSRAQEVEIERIYAQREFRNISPGNIEQTDDAGEHYVRFLADRFPSGSFKHNSRIVVDTANGAAAGFAPKLFARIGLDVLPLNDTPDGHFPGRDPEPKEDTLQGTYEFMKQHGADFAVCFDGDADRVVFMDKAGFIGFNEAVAFISRLAIARNGKKKVAATVETGNLTDLAVRDLGAEVVRGKVGDVRKQASIPTPCSLLLRCFQELMTPEIYGVPLKKYHHCIRCRTGYPVPIHINCLLWKLLSRVRLNLIRTISIRWTGSGLNSMIHGFSSGPAGPSHSFG